MVAAPCLLLSFLLLGRATAIIHHHTAALKSTSLFSLPTERRRRHVNHGVFSFSCTTTPAPAPHDYYVYCFHKSHVRRTPFLRYILLYTCVVNTRHRQGNRPRVSRIREKSRSFFITVRLICNCAIICNYMQYIYSLGGHSRRINQGHHQYSMYQSKVLKIPTAAAVSAVDRKTGNRGRWNEWMNE